MAQFRVLGGAVEGSPVGGAVGSREVEGWGLVEVELGLRRAACGGQPGRPMEEIEMEQDELHGGQAGGQAQAPAVAED